MSETVTTRANPTKPRSRWPERLWIALAVVLIGVSAAMFGLRKLVRAWTGDPITHQVSADLERVDRIEAEPGDLRGFNVVFITTDTTRADHIGCYGNRAIRTPVIDRLAREGVLCAQNVTPSPSTVPAHSSLLTGLYPVHHGARSNGTFRLENKITTLAERLRDKGYRTGAVISAFVLDSRFGLDQGFEQYHDDLTKGMKYSPHMFRERAAELTNEPATQFLREHADEPFFLWVHYFDPHAVYLPPEPFRSEYASNLYDGEIAYVDSQIGALLSQLEELGVRDKTLVVYTADHGEGHGEHGEQTHSLLVYDATLHIPLIFNAPSKLPQGKAIERQTCLVDVAPTVLSLLGEEVPADLDGLNLCAPSSGASRPVLVETIATMAMHGWAPLVGVRRDDFKYILAPTPELYDLSKDPRELKNIHDEHPRVTQELGQHLAAWLGKDPYLAARGAVDLSGLDVDKETLSNLAALGYVATVKGQHNPAADLPDPKERIVHWETLQKAINMQAEGKSKEAIPVLEACVSETPQDVFSRSVLAGAYRQLGEFDRAMNHFRLAAEADPTNATLRLGIAGILMSQQKFDEAEEEIAAALKIEPENAHAYVVRGSIAHFRRRDDQALEFYRKAIVMDPGSTGATAYNQIGFLHLYAGRLDEARDAFRSAIRIDELDGAAHDGLANILQLEGKPAEAKAELAKALYFDPNQPRALSTLAAVLSQEAALTPENDQARALELCRKALEISPKYGAALNNLGLIYRRRGDLELAEQQYQKAIELEPHLDAAVVNLAQLYLRQGKPDVALEQFHKAIQANPVNPSPIALANVGANLFNSGKYDQALAHYRRALRADPDYALVHKQIASIFALESRADPVRAAFHLRRSLELDPDQPDAAQMREILKRATEAAAAQPAAKTPPIEPTAPPDGTPPPMPPADPSNAPSAKPPAATEPAP